MNLSAQACALVVLGVVQSFGPCVFARATWLATLTSSSTRPWLTISLFVSGVILGYEFYVAAVPLVQLFLGYLSVIYGLAALGMAIAAFRGLRRVDHGHTEPTGRAGGGVFIAGVSTVAQFSSCCTIAAIAIVAMAPSNGLPGTGLLLAAYGFGHALPLVAAAIGTVGMRRYIDRFSGARAFAYVNAGMMLYLAVYFAVQA
jgi:cytochrome c biogenesis protein CcdA